jgi:hypothetical protein
VELKARGIKGLRAGVDEGDFFFGEVVERVD